MRLNSTSRFCWRCAATLSSAPPVRCDACGQDHYNNPRPAAEAVVIRGRDVLLIRRARNPWKDCWDIPGGFLEPNEHPSTAAERELLEETGLRGQASDLLGMWLDEYGTPEPDGMRIATLNIAYRVILLSEERNAVADDEALEAEWLPLDSLPHQLAFPDHARAVLNEAARHL